MHNKETYKYARKKPAVVYWIHYVDQTNPEIDGYIGISTQVLTRIKNHVRGNPRMRNRLNKGAVVTILHEVESLDEAAKIEEKYRPSENIGWNQNAGGDVPPDRSGTCPKKNKSKGDDRTERQKKASQKHKERMTGRAPWNKGKRGVQKAWNKGLANIKLKELSKVVQVCPHCKKEGKGLSMQRWHFDNCKFKTGV